MDDTVDRSRLTSSQQSPAQDVPPEPQLQPKPPRGGGLVKWLFALAIAIACIFAWEEFEKREPNSDNSRAAGPPPQTIRDAAITSGDVPIIVNALGAVTPLATVTVHTQINGQLQKIGFVEGQMVKAGDFLAQIDDRPYQATLAQFQGQLAKDTELYNQAKADLARYETLVKQDSIARQQADDQVFLVKQDEGAMAVDQAQIDAAKVNIAYCHIVATVSGRVGLRQVDAGNYVQTTDTGGIVVITELEPISVLFPIPEDNLPQVMTRLKAGATLTAVAFDRSNATKLATGSLAAVDNQIDTTTGTVKLRANFENKDDLLFPQQFVNIQLIVDTMANAVVTPNGAIQQGSQGSFVYVVNQDQTVSVRQIKTGPVDGERTAVLSGLKVGENVVIDGADRLKEGAKVQVRNASSQATGAAGAKPAGANGASGAADGQQPDQQHRHRRQGQQGQGQSGQDQ